jgi:hypothetical protein
MTLAINLPPLQSADVQIYTGVSTVTNTQWRTWTKPYGRSMLNILCIGGGGGGGGGFTAAAGNARGGGGGGGSSGQTRVLVPLHLLPDVLYIQVGVGGAGVGSGGGTAPSGVLSYVAIAPNTTATNVLAVSGNAAAAGGGTGTGAAVGAAGVAGTIATIANMPLAGLGHHWFIAGQIGAAGGAVAGAIGGPAVFPTTSVLTMGGAGGAGTTSADFAGGIITAITSSFLSEARPQGAAAGSNPGSSGFLLTRPFFSYCGLGGSASNSGVGGAGGYGGPGSGGGGGGGGTTGGVGGTGGAGIVVMTAW